MEHGVLVRHGMRAIEAAARAAIALVWLGLLADAEAAELRIADVKAYAYLERAGRLSENLIGGQRLIDAPRGGALDGDTATALLLDFTFEGDRNASPKYATATVDLIQISALGERVVTHKAFTNFIFGADGVEHKVVFLEGATCMPLGIEVNAGRTSKSARLDFQCEATRASN